MRASPALRSEVNWKQGTDSNGHTPRYERGEGARFLYPASGNAGNRTPVSRFSTMLYWIIAIIPVSAFTLGIEPKPLTSEI
jgi:hypothetical protein